jgi:hypothetical protein
MENHDYSWLKKSANEKKIPFALRCYKTIDVSSTSYFDTGNILIQWKQPSQYIAIEHLQFTLRFENASEIGLYQNAMGNCLLYVPNVYLLNRYGLATYSGTGTIGDPQTYYCSLTEIFSGRMDFPEGLVFKYNQSNAWRAYGGINSPAADLIVFIHVQIFGVYWMTL